MRRSSSPSGRPRQQGIGAGVGVDRPRLHGQVQHHFVPGRARAGHQAGEIIAIGQNGQGYGPGQGNGPVGAELAQPHVIKHNDDLRPAVGCRPARRAGRTERLRVPPPGVCFGVSRASGLLLRYLFCHSRSVVHGLPFASCKLGAGPHGTAPPAYQGHGALFVNRFVRPCPRDHREWGNPGGHRRDSGPQVRTGRLKSTAIRRFYLRFVQWRLPPSRALGR